MSLCPSIRVLSFSPLRGDNHERKLWMLEPSHRMSLLKFNRSGVLLPFGAPSGQFDSPNRFLFTQRGQWLQSDDVSPLDSWEYVACSNLHLRWF